MDVKMVSPLVASRLNQPGELDLRGMELRQVDPHAANLMGVDAREAGLTC